MPNVPITKACLILVASLACQGLAAQTAPTLDELMSSTPNLAETVGIPEIRYNALVETASTRGNAAGLAWQSEVIKKRLEKMASNLDIIYNFGALMMEGNVLPPVMSKAVDVFDQQSDDVIRLVGETYSIRQPARFTYVAPSWRSYLVASDYSFDISVPPLITPESPKEKTIWAKAMAEGYQAGIEQANQILEANFVRLKADFEGMRLYRELLRKGMVTKPYVSTGHYGVTGDRKKTINIGESLLRISVSPEFVMENEKWTTQPQGQTAEKLKAAQQRIIDEPPQESPQPRRRTPSGAPAGGMQ